MHTEVLLATKLCEYGVRNSTDTHLQGCTILDKTGTEVTNLCLNLVRCSEVSLLQWLIVLNKEVDT